MSKKNLHIKKYLDGKLPEPEVQADDAWGQMSGMLGQTPLPDSQLQSAGKFKYFLKYGLGLLSGVTIVAGSWLLLPESNTNKTAVKSSLEENLQDSVVLHATLEELKPNIAEDLITGEKSLVMNSAGTPTDHITDSLSNNKTDIKQSIDTKNKSVDSGLASRSKIIVPDTKTNSAFKETGRNRSTPLVAESDHFENTLKKKIRSKIASNRLPENYKNNEQRINWKEWKSGNKNLEKSIDLGNSQSSHIEENNDLSEKIIETKSTGKIIFSAKKLIPKSTRFPGPKKNRIVTIPVKSEGKKEESIQAKTHKPLLKTLHIGLEWNATSSFKDTKYLLPGSDSTSKPYLLLIPGLWISKDLDEKQSVTASFFVSQQYFAGNKLIKQTLDSTIKDLFYNTHMIKAVGINLSLQYNYQVFSNLAFSAGLGYSKLNAALFQESMKNYAGEVLPISMLYLKRPDLSSLVQTNLVTLKAGFIFNPGRFQLGANLIMPLTNVSATSLPLRTLNGQLFFRVRLN